jgi:hypothetical protein
VFFRQVTLLNASPPWLKFPSLTDIPFLDNNYTHDGAPRAITHSPLFSGSYYRSPFHSDVHLPRGANHSKGAIWMDFTRQATDWIASRPETCQRLQLDRSRRTNKSSRKEIISFVKLEKIKKDGTKSEPLALRPANSLSLPTITNPGRAALPAIHSK